MTSDYHNTTEHGPHEQQPGSKFHQLIDHSYTLNTVHVIGSQNHPEVSWLLIGPRRSHVTAMCTTHQTPEYS